MLPIRRTPGGIAPAERDKPLTRAELEDALEQRDERLLLRLQAQIQIGRAGIVAVTALPDKPPMPGIDGYTFDDVFDWWVRAPRYVCWNLAMLAKLIGVSYGYLRNKFSEYKAQYGEQPMPPGRSRFQ